MKYQHGGRLKCGSCNRFISFSDIADGKAQHRLVYPLSDRTVETWESVCEVCLDKERAMARADT